MGDHKPGDIILDRYLPHADEETRERARDVLRKYAAYLIRVGERIERERSEEVDSEKSARRLTI